MWNPSKEFVTIINEQSEVVIGLARCIHEAEYPGLWEKLCNAPTNPEGCDMCRADEQKKKASE